MENLNELIPAGARKVIYVIYGVLATVVAAAGQALTTAHEVGIETGDLSKYVAIAGSALLVIGGAFGFTAAAHVLKGKSVATDEAAAVEQAQNARRADADDVEEIPGDDIVIEES